jgi:hypothetical protein
MSVMESSPMTNEAKSPLAEALEDMPLLRKRLESGQQFNAYQSANNENCWRVAIGPVTDHRVIADDVSWRIANLLVDALRFASGQQPQSGRAFDDGDF